MPAPSSSGAGSSATSVAYHLTDQGWSDVVLLDKGPLPNPGGSTGHASNFIYPVDHSKEMTQLTLESMRQYKEMGVFTECGGVEVARTEERMQELTRRVASAKAWGIEPVSLVTPAEVKELVPFIDETVILGGFYTPVGRASSTPCGPGRSCASAVRSRAGSRSSRAPRCSGWTSSPAAFGGCERPPGTSRRRWS